MSTSSISYPVCPYAQASRVLSSTLPHTLIHTHTHTHTQLSVCTIYTPPVNLPATMSAPTLIHGEDKKSASSLRLAISFSVPQSFHDCHSVLHLQRGLLTHTWPHILALHHPIVSGLSSLLNNYVYSSSCLSCLEKRWPHQNLLQSFCPFLSW